MVEKPFGQVHKLDSYRSECHELDEIIIKNLPVGLILKSQ